MIRISQIHEGSELVLIVEGTLSDGWVDALEMSWLEAQAQSNGEPVRIDLSGVVYVDDKGRDLLAQMLRCGAELRTTGIMNRAVIEEITKEIEGERDGGIQVEATEFTLEQTADGTDEINAGDLRTNRRTTRSGL